MCQHFVNHKPFVDKDVETKYKHSSLSVDDVVTFPFNFVVCIILTSYFKCFDLETKKKFER